jgi:hypothetical protein
VELPPLQVLASQREGEREGHKRCQQRKQIHILHDVLVNSMGEYL